jgi:endogenous inhibitor of DNA gyrase (YacG/DUF329 family)
MNICKNCGKLIETSNKYCSLKCRNVYVNKHLRNYKENGKSLSDRAKKLYGQNLKKCKLCEKSLSYEKRKNKFCSKECRSKSLIKWNKNRKGIKKKFSSEGLNSIRIANEIRYGSQSYYKNPSHCKECNGELNFENRKRVFCCVKCRRKYDHKNLTKYQKYYRSCAFAFNLSNYPNEFDFELIKKYGWYQAKNHGNNLGGVSRDHMMSINFGYKNGIESEMIKHPANCQLLVHNDNSSKNNKCSLTLDELQNRINEWNKKYK